MNEEVRQQALCQRSKIVCLMEDREASLESRDITRDSVDNDAISST
jgi:hypothetical protein